MSDCRKDVEREKFEQTFGGQYTDFERFENGEYMDDFLQQSWIGWQARREAASVSEWIKCSDRIPAEYDGDFEGLVWVNDRDMKLPKYAQSRVHWSHVRGISGYTHWKPTNLVRPEQPKQE
jgi:hypothetical protein